MVPELCLDDRVERLKGVIGIRHRSAREILISEKRVQVHFEAVIRASGSPVCIERLAVVCNGLFFEEILPLVVPTLQHGTEQLLIGGG